MTGTRAHAYMHVYIYIHAHTHTHVYMYLCVCVCTVMGLFPSLCTHTPTHTHNPSFTPFTGSEAAQTPRHPVWGGEGSVWAPCGHLFLGS